MEPKPKPGHTWSASAVVATLALLVGLAHPADADNLPTLLGCYTDAPPDVAFPNIGNQLTTPTPTVTPTYCMSLQLVRSCSDPSGPQLAKTFNISTQDGANLVTDCNGTWLGSAAITTVTSNTGSTDTKTNTRPTGYSLNYECGGGIVAGASSSNHHNVVLRVHCHGGFA
jgi:hypothetical protein